MAKMFNCNLEVREFELQSRYYVHFRTNNLKKVINPCYELNCLTTILL